MIHGPGPEPKTKKAGPLKNEGLEFWEISGRLNENGIFGVQALVFGKVTSVWDLYTYLEDHPIW